MPKNRNNNRNNRNNRNKNRDGGVCTSPYKCVDFGKDFGWSCAYKNNGVYIFDNSAQCPAHSGQI